MSVRFELHEKPHPYIRVTDLISVQAIDRSFFGKEVNGKKIFLDLQPEEALYLMDVRKAECEKNGKPVSFNQVAAAFDGPKFLARYYGFRDWRDRGLIARPIYDAKGPYGRSPTEKYPAADYKSPHVKAKGQFFYDDLMSIIDDNEEGNALYENHWFGQFGTYKAKKHGQFLKLDAYETLFLARHGKYKLNVPAKKIEEFAVQRRPDFLELYDVYEDWRLRGFVPKTGFKFGTHFRLYFPGAKPTQDAGQWMHSRHVVHVFPRASKMLISEWARAIRVAHGVKKTFILAIPGASVHPKENLLDFLLYHRKGGDIETPRHDSPTYVMLALSEEEQIGGQELAEAIEQAKALGLDLVLAICDRETAITYYRVKRIDLPKSKYEYYEIEWVQP